MKKIVSLLTTLLALISSTALGTTYAQDETALTMYVESHNVDENTFRFSADACDKVNNFSNATEKLDCSYALAVLSVLAHNGDISVTTLSPDAKSIKEVDLCTELNKEIYEYSISLNTLSRDLAYGDYYSSHNQDELINKILEYAETSDKNSTYFLARLRSGVSRYINLVCIGLVDGNWNFNGDNYDKCIPTINPELKQENFKDVFPYDALGFTESSCIYINSKDKKIYIPEYSEDNKKEIEIMLVTNDFDILNYKSNLNNKREVSSKDIRRIRMMNMAHMDYMLSIQGEVNKTITADCFELPENLSKSIYQYGKEANLYTSFKTYVPGDAVSFDIKESDISKEMYSPTNGWQKATELYVDSNVSQQTVICYGEFYTEMYDNKILIKKKSNNESDGNIISNQNKGFDLGLHLNETPLADNEFGLSGISDGEIVFEVKPEGIVISCESIINTVFNYGKDNVDGILRFTSSNPIMLKKNDLLDQYRIYIDMNEDGVFECEVKKGDINCDGIIDACDATAVLTDYALTSANKDNLSFVNADLADYDDNDVVDGRDATAILTTYAKLSVNN